MTTCKVWDLFVRCLSSSDEQLIARLTSRPDYNIIQRPCLHYEKGNARNVNTTRSFQADKFNNRLCFVYCHFSLNMPEMKFIFGHLRWKTSSSGWKRKGPSLLTSFLRSLLLIGTFKSIRIFRKNRESSPGHRWLTTPVLAHAYK